MFIGRALRLARKGYGRTSPNPAVGAVLVKNGKIVGEGYHKKAGQAHAEVSAIRAAGKKAKGADLYINLEPCSHYGKTPPCAHTVVKAGIKRAFISMADPNPRVAGKGISILGDAGIEVKTGIREKEARKLNEAFIKHVTTGLPFVTLKAASTLDGRIATKTGESKWITGEGARRQVHKMRDCSDAIMVGIGTIRKDDPSLTTRLGERKGKDPVRVVVDENLIISPGAKVINRNSEAPLIIATTDRAPEKKVKELEHMGVRVFVFPDAAGIVPLKPLMKKLGQMDINSLMIEGGSEIHASALREGIVDKIALFYAPKIMGGVQSVSVVGGEGANLLAEAIEIEAMKTKKIGPDILIEGYIKKNA
ncbi:MAG: bifunctional diaminohydroxyphosphoribosylaminopyrimidine deaminase/5-amino-6-(5-phosphoribosylamino)uracil reductase RibD [Deltaproteobacteria bacterium]|nr:bifunctional diaminohydroxyphosphoribosylaminopyrimidine deaminase/5-amino-6-(5-phosphoribosylamino)uracil reductase RibD [Deltaproteobacteria bacterium]